MGILSEYEEASGQRINRDKCSVSFDKCTREDRRRELLSILGMSEVADQGKYLGLPSQIGRTKREVFKFLVEKVDARIRGWKGKLLSQAGKEVMIKSVTSAIPIFVMNCLKLPVGTFETLNNFMAKFFWGKAEGDKGIHWKSWNKLCNEKFDGGLGFKDLECMNLALLAKQRWRIVTRQASLLFKLLKSRYFRQPWVPRSSDFFVRGERRERVRWVSQLMTNGQWIKEEVESCLQGDDIQRVLAIPLSRRGIRDKLIWSHTRCGKYCTCSGYKCARNMKKRGELPGKEMGESSSREEQNEAHTTGAEVENWTRVLQDYGMGSKVELEADLQSLISMLKGEKRIPIEVEVILEDIIDLTKYMEVKFQYVKRSINNAVHPVAHWNHRGVK
ncbi:hypothetical protein LIER_16910 [Lithospermum erythrorhizon]|uniref:Reverse transcriptase n=1 Tax=Lithospermum erythrorhizon TaxID=34254 RepID=A0AAV3Q955_LITER